MDHRDHYTTLGVPRDATAKQIRDAYRKLARQYHPDLHPGDPAAEETLKDVNAAYEVLSDTDKRRKYNMLGTDWSAILRDEDTLRREAGFAPVAEAAASSAAAAGRVYRDATNSYGAFANSARVAIVGLALAGLALIAPYGWRTRGEAVQPQAAVHFQRTAASIRELAGALGQLGQLLDEGVDVWTQVCVNRSMQTDGFLDGTVKPNYQRRYREGVEAVIALITRAEGAGAFALPLTASDRAVLRSLVPLRDELQEARGASPLDCRNDLPVYRFRALAQQTDTARRCLDALSRLPPKDLATRSAAGRDVCLATASSR
jgi:hypothetical protein